MRYTITTINIDFLRKTKECHPNPYLRETLTKSEGKMDSDVPFAASYRLYCLSCSSKVRNK